LAEGGVIKAGAEGVFPMVKEVLNEHKLTDDFVQKTMEELDLRGNGVTHDSLSLAIKAAAELLGCETDYETIYCLSSNAFAPAIDLGEPATCWWHLNGLQSDKCLETVAAAIGLKVEYGDLHPDNLDATLRDEVFDRMALRHRKACAGLLREKMAQGTVFLTIGGFKVETEEGFSPWCWWGIVTQVNEDGDFRGACLKADFGNPPGFANRPIDYDEIEHALTFAPDELVALQA